MMKPIPSGLLNLTEIDPSSVVLTFRVSNFFLVRKSVTPFTVSLSSSELTITLLGGSITSNFNSELHNFLELQACFRTSKSGNITKKAMHYYYHMAHY